MVVPVIACYRPKPGGEKALLAEVERHQRVLSAEGLVTDREAFVMRARDGTVLEIFEWRSQQAIDDAHGNPEVQNMWKRFQACCEYVPLAELSEAQELFAGFAPVRFYG